LDKFLKNLVADRFLNLQPYKAEAFDGPIKLDAMEMPHGLPADEMKSLLNQISEIELNRYPDPDCDDLREKILDSHGLKKKGLDIDVLLGNGSDELIFLLCQLTAKSPSSSILIPTPTFSVYKISAQIANMKIEEINTRKTDFELDNELFLHSVREKKPSLIFLASPNNPTGNVLTTDFVRQICEECNGLVVLDEAYWKFFGESKLLLLKEYSNLLVLQTMSKIGFANIRLGMLFGGKDLISLIKKIKMPYNINGISQAIANFILSNNSLVDKHVKNIVSEREKMSEKLLSLNNLKVWKSHANFILVRTNSKSSTIVHKELLNEGIYVKNMNNSHPLLRNCLRITIGLEHENKELFRQMAKSVY